MAYSKEEKKSRIKWFCGAIAVGVFGYATAWLMFNLAWLFKRHGKNSWFWWWMDDERFTKDGKDYAPDYKSYLIRFGKEEENWWVAWNWHTRNSIWNLKRSKYLVNSTPAEVGNNNIEGVRIIIDELYRLNADGTKTPLKQDGIWVQDAGLKYIPTRPGEDIWQVNQGDEISYKTSILGEGKMWFYAAGKNELMFRYSECKIVEYKIFGIRIWRGWRTIKMGYGNKSYVSTIKHQGIKPWK